MVKAKAKARKGASGAGKTAKSVAAVTDVASIIGGLAGRGSRRVRRRLLETIISVDSCGPSQPERERSRKGLGREKGGGIEGAKCAPLII